MERYVIRRILALVFAAFFVTGCVQTSPVPGVARAGDVIVIGLGGIERNADGAAAIRPSDLSITLTDSANNPYTLEAKYVFKSYPDHASFYNTSIQNNAILNTGITGTVAYDGGWFVMARLMDPGTNDPITGLAVGNATVSVTSSKLTNINSGPEGNLASLPLEIISGSSPFNETYERQFLAYQHGGNSFQVSPDDLTGITEVGGGYFVINYNDDSAFASGLEPVVVPTDHNPYVQLSYNVVSNGDGTGSIYVTLLNPAGFKTQATAQPNSSLLSNLNFQMMYYSNNTVTQLESNFSVDTVESYYIGMDGSVLAGVSPVMTHYENL